MFKNDFIERFGGEFWTNTTEMLEEFVEFADEYDYELGFVSDEYASLEDEDGNAVIVYFGHANSTMWVQRAESNTL